VEETIAVVYIYEGLFLDSTVVEDLSHNVDTTKAANTICLVSEKKRACTRPFILEPAQDLP
jgi:hypothetical protein